MPWAPTRSPASALSTVTEFQTTAVMHIDAPAQLDDARSVTTSSAVPIPLLRSQRPPPKQPFSTPGRRCDPLTSHVQQSRSDRAFDGRLPAGSATSPRRTYLSGTCSDRNVEELDGEVF